MKLEILRISERQGSERGVMGLCLILQVQFSKRDATGKSQRFFLVITDSYENKVQVRLNIGQSVLRYKHCEKSKWRTKLKNHW